MSAKSAPVPPTVPPRGKRTVVTTVAKPIDVKSGTEKDNTVLTSMADWDKWKVPTEIDMKTADVLFGTLSKPNNAITYPKLFRKFHGLDYTVTIPKSALKNIFRAKQEYYRSMTVGQASHPMNVDLYMLNFMVEHLKHIEFTPKGEIHVHLETGITTTTSASDAKTIDFELPSVKLSVLEIRHPTDPYLVNPLNKVVKVTTPVSHFRLKTLVRFKYNQMGIQESYDDDIRVIKASVAVNVNLKTQYKPDHIQLEYESQKPLLVVGLKGDPIVRDNHYVGVTSKMWLVLNIIGGIQIWLAAPNINGGSNHSSPLVDTTSATAVSPVAAAVAVVAKK